MKKRARAVATGGAILFFSLLAVSGNSRPVSYLRERAVQVLSPIAIAAQYAAGFFKGAPLEEIRGREDDQRRLAAGEAVRLGLQKENESLRRLLGVKENLAAPTASARVLAHTAVMGVETLLIDAGRDRGITAGDIVIDENGLLVGQVSETTAEGAKISVASNPGMAFSASLVPLGGKILIKGLGGRALALELIPYDTPLRDGDFVRWEDKEWRRTANIFVGRVVKGTSAAVGAFKTGRAVLLADPNALDFVLIITKQ